MRVAVIGTGYVGLVTGAGLAHTGNDVVCVDTAVEKIHQLETGTIPFYEPGLSELVATVRREGHLRFSTSVAEAVPDAQIVFLAVGTPSGSDGAADLSSVIAAAADVGRAIRDFTVVVTKSTVPVGTADKVKQAIAAVTSRPFAVASNPEFLKEGDAVNDFLRPARIVIGADDPRARDMLEDLYSPYIIREHKVFFMDIASAELTKYAANALLATKISFINEIAALCERVGADVELVRRAVGADPRIGSAFIYPGIGYGGSCFPKDISAIVVTAREHDYRFEIAEAVDAVNRRQRGVLLEKLLRHFGGSLGGRTIAVWGLSFKPQTDDVREAPALEIIRGAIERGARVRAYDPVAIPNARSALGRSEVFFADNAYQAAEGAHALCLCTEWPAFRQPDFDRLKKIMAAPAIFDGRNIYDPVRVRGHGFTYVGIGRP
ncbi:MAG: UDP-glucose/GDP-mannose dehydrogenase family protein [Deltaproteobacteria bacterium]|nr:UDP-glucose/GDP-mannose dehydrogenase family protein [Deltaproteobacteria bacterium]